VAGITGARAQPSDRVAGLVTRVRAHTDLPLLVGFGISAPEHAVAALAAGADGVIIGSKAIEVAEQGGASALAEFVRSVTEAVGGWKQPIASR
jgi:tryptophan synthase alpha chain